MALARHGITPLLIGRGLPVDRPPLTKAALADGVPRLLSDEARLDERGVERLDGTVALRRPRVRCPEVAHGQGEITVEAERIVLATGLAYPSPPVRGLEDAFVNANPHVFDRLGPLLTGGPVEVVVVGAGLIGTESAATLAQAGHAVTLVDMLERPLDRLHDPLPELGRATLDELGVRFLGGIRIESATRHALETAGHGTLEADVILVATGGVPLLPPGLAVGETELPLDRRRRHARPRLRPHLRVRRPRARAPRALRVDALPTLGRCDRDRRAGRRSDRGRTPAPTSGFPTGGATSGRGGSPRSGLQRRSRPGAWRTDCTSAVTPPGAPVCALVVDEPRRLREARALVSGGEA